MSGAAMSEGPLFSLHNPIFRISVGLTLGLVLLTALVGFVVLPLAQARTRIR